MMSLTSLYLSRLNRESGPHKPVQELPRVTAALPPKGAVAKIAELEMLEAQVGKPRTKI